MLAVDLWPDYDRASVLVLITGTLPPDAPLPAQVTLPLPQNATLNAVARITEAGEMIDDIAFETSAGTVTLTTPDRRFRVEYYMPYASDGLQREFTFSWPGGPSISQLTLSVQQPSAATSMTVQPEPESVITGSDGLHYHNLPVRQLQAAEPFTVQVGYQLSSEQLTAASATNLVDTPGVAAPAQGGLAVNWPTVLVVTGAGLILAAIGWQVFGARLAVRRPPRKPRAVRGVEGGSMRFCHECGARAKPGDRFCRKCGTQLKQG